MKGWISYALGNEEYVNDQGPANLPMLLCDNCAVVIFKEDGLPVYAGNRDYQPGEHAQALLAASKGLRGDAHSQKRFELSRTVDTHPEELFGVLCDKCRERQQSARLRLGATLEEAGR